MKSSIWVSHVLMTVFVSVFTKWTKAQCGNGSPRIIYPGNGTILSDNYGGRNGYNINLDCRWDFKRNEEYQYSILLNITEIKLYYKPFLSDNTCTGNLAINRGAFIPDTVDCLSTASRCYSYRTSAACETIQSEQHGDCELSTVNNFSLQLLFTSTSDNGGGEADRKFKIEYDYLPCFEASTTVGTTQSTGKTSGSATTPFKLVSTTNLTEGSSETTAIILPNDTAEVTTNGIKKTSQIAKTDGISKTTATLRTTSKTTTEPNMNHVVAITLGTLMIVLIIIGIVIIFLLFKKRSLPHSAEEFFGSVKNGKTPNSTTSDYDVVYKPRNNTNPTYNSIQVGNGNPTFQTDGDNEYSEATGDQQIKHQNTPNAETIKSDPSCPSTSSAADLPEYAAIDRKNRPSKGGSDKNEDSNGNERVEISTNIECHEYDLPPDAVEIDNADMTAADQEPPLYENFQKEGETTQ